MVAAAYLPALHNGFVNLDDPVFVYANRHVQGGLKWEGVRWAFTSVDRGFWQPLAWLSLMLDGELFGPRAGGYHLTSLVIHCVNTVLLFLALRKFTGATWRSAFVAGLFGIHPLHVESVAWASERKDVLSALFFMLSLLAYADYAKQPETTGLKRPWSSPPYLLCLLFFICGLMSKAMLVTLPVLLLFLDWWPLRRVSKSSWQFVLLEKAPFFALSLVFSITTVFAQKASGAVQTISRFPVPVRVGNAILSYAEYLVQMVWPFKLAAFYSYPRTFPALQLGSAALLIIVLTFVAVRAIERRPYILVGWLWYLVSLLPVIGLVQVGSQSHADRYTYIPLIGIFVCLAWVAHDLTARWQDQRVVSGIVATFLLLGCFVLSREQVGVWKESETLFQHALAVTKDNEIAHNNLGTAIFRKGKVDEAISHFQEAIRLRPQYALAWANLGTAYITKNMLGAAITNLQQAINLDPHYAGAFRNLGTALAKQGRVDESLPYFYKALSIDPRDAEAHYNLGYALYRKHRFDEAIEQFLQTLKLTPNDAATQTSLRMALAEKAGMTNSAPNSKAH
ncbi:MAG TPA: tetratricopeptide repeat protein [Candidatus Dormibacteraeota bacterium]|nr:tetratricopeptide repeat protein [Candidatus Dormibacteraeota bacterium]